MICVREKVGFQIAALVKASSAHGTFVGRFLHVENLVHGQGTALAETLAALAAFEGLLFAVDVPVTSIPVSVYITVWFIQQRASNLLEIVAMIGRRNVVIN